LRLLAAGPRSVALMIAIALAGCGERAREPVTLVFLDIGPWHNPEYAAWTQGALEGFTRETGVIVKRLPGPRDSDEQLVLQRQLLEGGAATPDVYVIDAIWPGMLGEHFLDLAPRLGTEVTQHFPALVSNNTVKGRLVAVPFHANVGILVYRTDLLRDHGFTDPPATWDELETMALAIQSGERARGRRDFWGYVWQGAPYEGLTCNALEWQASEGGGHIVEHDGTISVNNPGAIRAWGRAARWIGTLSPPEVVGYRELESENAWRMGNAAFLRSWPATYAASLASPAIQGRFAVTFVPAGPSGRAVVLGENSLAVSRYSRHADEAVAFVRYLSRHDVQLGRSRTTSMAPTRPDIYDDPAVLKSNPYYPALEQVLLRGALSRPSAVSGRKYSEVSRAYFRAVHSVLTGQQEAGAAVASLERELVWITGFPVRASEGSRSPVGRTTPHPAKTPPVRGERSPSPR
jgi:trehalose/maltose transport system substrate-binding protein